MTKEQKLLREMLVSQLRNDEQDGFPDLGPEGTFSSGDLQGAEAVRIWMTAEQLDALCTLADLRPDPIVPLGSCAECIHATPKGTKRVGRYGRMRPVVPCATCREPRMTMFHPHNGEERTPNGQNCDCRLCRRRETIRRLGDS